MLDDSSKCNQQRGPAWHHVRRTSFAGAYQQQRRRNQVSNDGAGDERAHKELLCPGQGLR